MIENNYNPIYNSLGRIEQKIDSVINRLDRMDVRFDKMDRELEDYTIRLNSLERFRAWMTGAVSSGSTAITIILTFAWFWLKAKLGVS